MDGLLLLHETLGLCLRYAGFTVARVLDVAVEPAAGPERRARGDVPLPGRSAGGWQPAATASHPSTPGGVPNRSPLHTQGLQTGQVPFCDETNVIILFLYCYW